MHAVIRYDDTVDAPSTLRCSNRSKLPIPRPRPSPCCATTPATTSITGIGWVYCSWGRCRGLGITWSTAAARHKTACWSKSRSGCDTSSIRSAVARRRRTGRTRVHSTSGIRTVRPARPLHGLPKLDLSSVALDELAQGHPVLKLSLVLGRPYFFAGRPANLYPPGAGSDAEPRAVESS